LDPDRLFDLSLAFRMPRNRTRGIGVVGAGSIINKAHLPAYKNAGFSVKAIFDLRRDSASETAARFGIPAVCSSVDELLARDDVEIVDIAIAPEAQVEVAADAIKHGKHTLCQKPLAETLAEAERLVAQAEAEGVLLAVNQQMRWSPGIRFTRTLIERGEYGALTECLFDVDLWSEWGWMGERPRVEYFYNSIHYIDAMRLLLGEPERLLASCAHYPGQRARAETRSFTILEFSDTLRGVILSNHNNWSGEPRAILRCHGADGRSETSLGMKDYPAASPDTFSFISRVGSRRIQNHEFGSRWLPDAFAGPMAELMCAIEEGRQPETSGSDNLGTLKIIEAAYRSIERGRRVELKELSPSVRA
jgi:predicted dehydrogenase